MNDVRTVMVVDDNLHARHALMAFISLRLGIRVAGEASNGLEAINFIQSQPPDIVLIDVQMPIMNGLDATRIIKKTWPEIKVIVLTLYPNYRTDALSAGADAFLIKGCPVEEIVSTIEILTRINKAGHFHQ